MKVITWNVNSVRKRLDHLLELINTEKPDAVLLQELKCTNEDFPLMEIEAAGYKAAVFGQKSYNGVAILSPHPITKIAQGLPTLDDEEARYLEADINGTTVASVYVPNGQEVDSEKFYYKLKFYNALLQHIKTKTQHKTPYILGGDFNVVDQDIDIYDADKTRGRILCSQPEKNALRALIHSGLVDCYRSLHPNEKEFSWWDYRDGSFEINKGMRIDYIFANASACKNLRAAYMKKEFRAKDNPSDHIPVVTNH